MQEKQDTTLVTGNKLLLANLEHLLSKVSPQIYIAQFSEPYAHISTLGKQTRHVLNPYQSLLRDFASGTIDFSRREFDRYIETMPDYASKAIEAIIADMHVFNNLNTEDIYNIISIEGNNVKGNIDAALQMAYSHTEHHLPLMIVEAYKHGIEVPLMGVNKSTLARQ